MQFRTSPAFSLAILSILAITLSACDSGSSTQPSVSGGKTPTQVSQPGGIPPVLGTPGNGAPDRPAVDAMLFTGKGTWSSEVASLAAILSAHGVSFEQINSQQLDALSLDGLSRYGTLIFPGG